MIDTPRTDAVPYDVGELFNHAQDLEHESDQLAKQCVKLVEEIGTLRAELRDAKEDSARIDWLDERVGLYDIAEYIPKGLLTHEMQSKLSVRAGVHLAMKQDKLQS